MNAYFLIATPIMTASLAAVAQTDSHLYRSGNEWIQEIRGVMPAAKVLKVKSSAGSIRLDGMRQNNITYTVREHVRAGSEEAARRELSLLKFTTSSGEVAWLRAVCEGAHNAYIDFDIQAPSQTAAARMETDGGGVTARDIAGKVDVATGGGGIELDQIGGAISVSSGGGDIKIGKAGSDVRAVTGGGDIAIDSAGGQIVARSGGGNLRIGAGKTMNLETGGGTIRVNQCRGWIRAETGGGNIELAEIQGPAEIEAGGGGIKVGPITGGIRAETESGPITAQFARGGKAFTDSRLETSVGDITVLLPSDLGVTLRASVGVARGEGIRCDGFPEIKITRSNNVGPREAYAEGSVNGGGPTLHVHTTTGNIVIKREP